MARIKLEGTEKLKKALQYAGCKTEIKRCVSKYGAKLNDKMVQKAPHDSGTLRRSITISKADNGLTVEVEPTVEYAPYLEYGTRLMEAQPFVKPSLDEVKPKFLSEIKKIMGD